MTDRPRRTGFFDMPPAVIDAVNGELGSPVEAFSNAANGFSSGPAGRADLQDGTVVFIKACGEQLNPFSVEMHRKEARVLPLLPEDYPAPALITTVEVDDWVVLVTEHLEGTTPTTVIDEGSTTAVLDLITSMAERGTPCPTEHLAPLGNDQDEFGSRTAWAEMVRHGMPERLDPWSRRHLAELAVLEADWAEAVAGDSLLHGDLRPDNMVLTGDGGGIAVDWPSATRGAPWVDLLGLLPALNMLNGPEPHEVFANHPVGAAADPAAVDSFLARLTGYFTSQSLRPPIENVPGIREFQAAQAAVCRTWLSERLGWDPPID